MENIKETTCCEDCPFSYMDMEEGLMGTLLGCEPQYRNDGEVVPSTCPLIKDTITVKLQK